MNQSKSMNPVPINTNPESRFFTENRQFQGIPGIEVAPNGRLWATWYSGGVTEGPDNFVVLVTSDDDGKTWTEPVAVCAPPDNIRAYDPAIWHDPLGRLWLFWAQCESQKNGNIFDGIAGVWGAYTENSNDPNPTWSEPVRLANGIMMNKPTVLSNGEWAFPTAVWDNKGGGAVGDDLLNEKFSNIVISPDQGKTFYRRGGADVPDRAFDEHMIVELNDHRLWMLVRTRYGIGHSFSDDFGKTWTPGEDTGIFGPNSRFFIRRLQSGKLLMINHKKEEGRSGRYNMAAWLSDDDGQTWYGELLLDEREQVSYPDGAEDKDGNIYITYDWNRYGAGDILFAKFREEDVVAGKPTSSDCRLKQLISHTGGVPDSKHSRVTG